MRNEILISNYDEDSYITDNFENEEEIESVFANSKYDYLMEKKGNSEITSDFSEIENDILIRLSKSEILIDE